VALNEPSAAGAAAAAAAVVWFEKLQSSQAIIHEIFCTPTTSAPIHHAATLGMHV